MRRISQGPVLASRRKANGLLAQLHAEPGPAVDWGRTAWGEPVVVPLLQLVEGAAVITGATGAGKTMLACLIIEALVQQLPHVRNLAFGVLDAKGELFERAIYLLGRRFEELNEQDRLALRRCLGIIDFAATDPVTSYNLLARWPYTDHDFFITSRLETLRELLPASEKLSLRGATVLRHGFRH